MSTVGNIAFVGFLVVGPGGCLYMVAGTALDCWFHRRPR